MLPLDSPRWAELRHAYGAAGIHLPYRFAADTRTRRSLDGPPQSVRSLKLIAEKLSFPHSLIQHAHRGRLEIAV